MSNEKKKFQFNHNVFTIAIVISAIAIVPFISYFMQLSTMMSANMIRDLTKEAIGLACTFALCRSFGGPEFSVTAKIKENPIAVAIFCGLIGHAIFSVIK